MAPELIADFPANIHASTDPTPRQGRVLLREDQCVAVTPKAQHTIPITRVADVRVGVVPEKLQLYFDDAITIAYQTNNGGQTVVIEGSADRLDRFRRCLFPCLLNDAPVQIRHPVSRGGRMIESTPMGSRLQAESGALIVRGPSAVVRFDLESVIGCQISRESFGGKQRPVIVLTTSEGPTQVVSHLVTETPRMSAILARYLTHAHQRLHREVATIDLDESELEALIAINSGVPDPRSIVNGEADPDTIMQSLQRQSLIESTADGYELTQRGQIAATFHVDRAIE